MNNEPPHNNSTSPPQPGSTNTSPPSHIHIEETRDGHCSECGKEIPPTWETCPEHNQVEASRAKEVTSHLMGVFVEADTRYQALAFAAAALNLADDITNSRKRGTLIYDIETPPETVAPPSSIEIRDAIKTTDETAERFLEVLSEQHQEKATNADLPYLDINPVHIRDSTGTELSPAEAREYIGQDGAWLVPGVISIEKPETETRHFQTLDCPDCGHTKHNFIEERERWHTMNSDNGIWKCLSCGSRKYGPIPRGYSPKKPWERTPRK